MFNFVYFAKIDLVANRANRMPSISVWQYEDIRKSQRLIYGHNGFYVYETVYCDFIGNDVFSDILEDMYEIVEYKNHVIIRTKNMTFIRHKIQGYIHRYRNLQLFVEYNGGSFVFYEFNGQYEVYAIQADKYWNIYKSKIIGYRVTDKSDFIDFVESTGKSYDDKLMTRGKIVYSTVVKPSKIIRGRLTDLIIITVAEELEDR